MRIILLVGLLLCAACSYLNPTTLTQLSRLSPLTADPAGFEVYVTLPDNTELAPGGALLDLHATRSDTGETLAETIVLAQKRTDSGLVWTVPKKDLPRLRAAQEDARTWESEAPDATSGSLSVALKPCFIGRTPELDETFSIALRLSPDGPIRPFLRNVPLSKILEKSSDLSPDSDACNG